MNSHEEQTAAVDEILSRGIGEFFDPDGSFRKKLTGKMSGTYTKDIVIKFGVDPTRPDIHLGHAAILRKLRTLQDVGCKIIFLIGDFTTQIGDPTGKSRVRPELSQQEIENNLNTYLEQVGKILLVDRDDKKNILHTNKFSWMRNSDWYVGVTDIATDPDGTVDINIHQSERTDVVKLPANSFIGKAALFENTRMQRAQLQKQEVVGITLINLLSYLRKITHAQLIERDMFQERLAQNESLYMHEMLYPVIQGLDSVMIAKIYGSCDMEIGGSDQTFNMLMGRRVMEMSEQEPQAVVGMKLLVGTDGKEKMSKSLDNYIAINDSANEMYGKTMSVPDTALLEYFTLSTYVNSEELNHIEQSLKDGKSNPRDVKMYLARQLVAMYHGEEAAAGAEAYFISAFQKGAIPDDIPTLSVERGAQLSTVLVTASLVPSKTEYRRLLDAGAIRKDGEIKITDPHATIEDGMVLRIGKHQFVRLQVK